MLLRRRQIGLETYVSLPDTPSADPVAGRPSPGAFVRALSGDAAGVVQTGRIAAAEATAGGDGALELRRRDR